MLHSLFLTLMHNMIGNMHRVGWSSDNAVLVTQLSLFMAAVSLIAYVACKFGPDWLKIGAFVAQFLMSAICTIIIYPTIHINWHIYGPQTLIITLVVGASTYLMRFIADRGWKNSDPEIEKVTIQ